MAAPPAAPMPGIAERVLANKYAGMGIGLSLVTFGTPYFIHKYLMPIQFIKKHEEKAEAVLRAGTYISLMLFVTKVMFTKTLGRRTLDAMSKEATAMKAQSVDLGKKAAAMASIVTDSRARMVADTRKMGAGKNAMRLYMIVMAVAVLGLDLKLLDASGKRDQLEKPVAVLAVLTTFGVLYGMSVRDSLLVSKTKVSTITTV